MKKVIEIQNKKGEILSNFAYIELLVRSFILNNYSIERNNLISSDVFEDEYFNFGLLLHIFEKVVKRKGVGSPNKLLEDLRRMGKIRNIVAHAPIQAHDNNSSKEEDYSIFLKHGGKEISIDEIEKMYKEYDVVKVKVTSRILEIS
jgi:hypothetical protein